MILKENMTITDISKLFLNITFNKWNTNNLSKDSNIETDGLYFQSWISQMIIEIKIVWNNETICSQTCFSS